MCVILYYIFITINFTLSERNSVLNSVKGGSCVTRKRALRKFIQWTALLYWSDDDADADADADDDDDDDDDDDKGGLTKSRLVSKRGKYG